MEKNRHGHVRVVPCLGDGQMEAPYDYVTMGPRVPVLTLHLLGDTMRPYAGGCLVSPELAPCPFARHKRLFFHRLYYLTRSDKSAMARFSRKAQLIAS